uniref:Holliday junction branch migration protein RuvA n=1 Tax=Eubacterium cellulosolvens TaxID=29322 RepID=UPI0004888276|nr:Holliday junction branch migration protein RuvA [[Eubacterium] cellulosolvens]
MIGFIKGTIEEITEDSVVVDNNGIGWQVFVPGSSLAGSIRQGEEIKLYTYLSVKQDSLSLFGFLNRDDREVFIRLLDVSGIGPKGALGILSVMSSDDLRFAVLSDDAAAIAKAPGIGKKTAQKAVLELKDKFKLDDAFEKKLAHEQEKAGTGATAAGAGAETDAVQALVALGYSGTEAMQAVRKVGADESMDSEAILKAALKFLF